MTTVPTYFVDANVLVRYLTNDDTTQSPAAKRLVDNANAGKCLLEVPSVIVSEVFYALKVGFDMDRPTIAKGLAGLFSTPAFYLPELDRIIDALRRVESKNVDYGDAYLAAAAHEESMVIASFDKDLDKFTDVTRMEPSKAGGLHPAVFQSLLSAENL